MKLFDSTNKRHISILQEELVRIKRILNEGFEYSTDEIWSNMTQEERNRVAGGTGYESATSWDDIPADVQDSINLSDYELAVYDMGGRSSLRGIENLVRKNPEASKVVDAFLKRVDRKSLNTLTAKQAMNLNVAIIQFLASPIASNKPSSDINPRDFGGGPSMASGRRGWTGD